MVRLAGVATSLPIVLVGGPGIGFAVGQLIDHRFFSDPWGVACGVLIGLIAGICEAVVLIKFIQRLNNSSKDESS